MTIYDVFDTGKYNNIMMSYIRIALKELVNEDVLDDDQARAVRNRVNCLLSEMKAIEAYNKDHE